MSDFATLEVADRDAASPPVWRIGETVPWVAPWTGEDEFSLQPSTDFPGKMELVQSTDPGVGTPVLDGMHVMRQRRGVAEHLCHVCGRPTPRHDRWLFPVITGGFTPVADGSMRYTSHLPPVHLACARHAQTACPHVRATAAHPVRFPEKPGHVLCETNPPAKMSGIAAGLPPGMQVIYGYVRVHTAGFTRLVQRLRAADEAMRAHPSPLVGEG